MEVTANLSALPEDGSWVVGTVSLVLSMDLELTVSILTLIQLIITCHSWNYAC